MAGDNPRSSSRLIPLGRESAAKLRWVVREVAGDAPEFMREFIALIDRREAASNAWRFGLVGLAQDEAVVHWLAENARRTRVSVKLWASMKKHMRNDTQEVLMDRVHMMRAVRAPSSHISEALSELARIGAVERRQQGRDVRWFISANIATHLTGAARDQAQKDAPPLIVGAE